MKHKRPQKKQVKLNNLNGSSKKIKKKVANEILFDEQELIEYYQIHNERTRYLLKKYEELFDTENNICP
jgi:hypothetical protein